MNKLDAYKDLAVGRKSCHVCKGIYNPSTFCGGLCDSKHVGPWLLWQSNLGKLRGTLEMLTFERKSSATPMSANTLKAHPQHELSNNAAGA